MWSGAAHGALAQLVHDGLDDDAAHGALAAGEDGAWSDKA